MGLEMQDTDRNESRDSGVIYRFGLFALDMRALSLTRNGLRIKLQDQPFQLLAFLLERSGEVVTREELRQQLWPGNTFVDFDKSLGVAVLKVREALGDSATNPTFLETLPRRGYRFIAPVTVEPKSPVSTEERAEEKSGASVQPVSALAGAVPIPTPISTPIAVPVPEAVPIHGLSDSDLTRQAAQMRRRKLWTRVALVCVTMGLGLAAFHFRPGLMHGAVSVPRSGSQTKLRHSVAVLGFRNVSGSATEDWLSTAFTEMLNTELGANGDLLLVSGEDVVNAEHDLSLHLEDTLAKDTLTRLRSSLGADVVVVGSYTLLKDGQKNQIRLDIRAQDTALGETITEDAITGEQSDLFDIAAQAGSRLRESLDPALSLAPGREAPRFQGSTNQVALQFFSEGRARSYDFDFVGARDFLKRAVAADPEFALAHSALSEAWSRLGYENEARNEAKVALRCARGLAPETALAIQGQYRETLADWSGAAAAYRTLRNLFPDNLNYGLRLASAQLHLNPADAASTLGSLRKLPSPVGDDPRIDLMDASVMIHYDLPKARAAAERAISKASAQGATLMVARGYGVLCQQGSSGSESIDRSISECMLARNSYLSAGDRNNAARTLNDLAFLFYQHGDLDKAEQMWRQAIDVFRAVGDTEGLAASSNNVGDVLLTRGKLTEARKLLEQAIAGYQLVGDQSGIALAKTDLGSIALQRAELSEAQANYGKAFAIGSETGDKSASAFGLAGLGQVAMERDLLPEAREKYQAALKLRKEIGEKETVLQTRVALARLAIEEGNAADAERESNLCVDELDTAEMRDDELEAGLVLTKALLEQEKTAAAKSEMAKLRPLNEKTENRDLSLRFSLEIGEIFFAEHDLASARTLLEMVYKAAESSGYAEISEEAQMNLAHLQFRTGDRADASRQLVILEARAKNAGLELLAKKAHEIQMNLFNEHK
jgi:DNA-binding winged helix-turn-helix (wHTH) protein/tetratricopeptide (TPR) repeat protein